MTPVNEDNQATHWQQWQQTCADLGLVFNEAQQAQFVRFYDAFTLTNQSINLMRVAGLEDFLYRHLLDSLVLAPLIPEQARLADVGSGGGFPALPLAMVRPDVQVTAIESIGKKCKCIQELGETLGLTNLTVLNERSETLSHQPATREQFEVVTARAVASLPSLLELCLPLVKVGGQFLAMKGLSYEAELAASERALKQLGGQVREVRQFEPASLQGSRLVVIEKVRSTPIQYPRSAGLPTKKPL